VSTGVYGVSFVTNEGLLSGRAVIFDAVSYLESSLDARRGGAADVGALHPVTAPVERARWTSVFRPGTDGGGGNPAANC
jgi:hypothetical protein